MNITSTCGRYFMFPTFILIGRTPLLFKKFTLLNMLCSSLLSCDGTVIQRSALRTLFSDPTSGKDSRKSTLFNSLMVAQLVKNLPAMQEKQVQFLDQEDPLEKEMANHSSILVWEIPWTEEPGGLWSMGSQRVIHNLATKPPSPKKKHSSLLLTGQNQIHV